MLRYLLLLLFSRILFVSADDDDADYSQIVYPCEEGVVQVINITVLCDSPYTFYYGNGAHRNSPVCDYGDKVTLHVDLEIQEAVESSIYVQMSAYDDADEQLYLSSSSLDLCNDVVGEECSAAGYYSFTQHVQFAYIDGDQSGFVPLWEIVFSEDQNGDYDLGAVNVDCDYKDGGSSSFVDWTLSRTNSTRFKETETFAQEYGILLLTLISLTVLGTVLFRSNSQNLDYTKGTNARHARLLNEDGGKL